MAVNTPQLEEPVYQPQQMQAPPMATGSPNQVLPAQAGFVPKAGAAAYVANSIVDGWLKGRQIAAQRNLQNAQQQLGSLYRNYSDQREQWKSLAVQDPKSPATQQAYQDAMTAWQGYNEARSKYVAPEDTGKKKPVKEKVKSGFGQVFGKEGVTPQLFAAQAVKLAQSHPEGLYLTPDDMRNQAQTSAAQSEAELAKTQTEAAKLTVDQAKRNDANDTKMQAIVQTPEADRTPEQRQWLEGWQRVQHIKDPESQKMADGIMRKIQSGQALTDPERNFAYAQHLLEGPQTTFRTGANGVDQMVTYSPDGKILGTVNLGHHYEPDQVGPAMRLMKMQRDFMLQEYKSAGMTDQQAEQALAVEQSKNPQLVAAFLGDSPVVREQQMSITDKALRSVFASLGGPGADPNLKKQLTEQYSNFLMIPQNSATGMFAFRDQLAPGQTSGWFNKKTTYAGGMTPETEDATRAALYNRVRAKMQEQNPKLTSLEIDRIIPEWLRTPAAQQTPAAAQPGAEMKPPPGPGLGQIAGTALALPFEAVNSGVTAAANALFAPPPADQGAATPGADGHWGTKEPGSKSVQLWNDESKKWEPAWMTQQQIDEWKSAGHKVKGTGPA